MLLAGALRNYTTMAWICLCEHLVEGVAKLKKEGKKGPWSDGLLRKRVLRRLWSGEGRG